MGPIPAGSSKRMALRGPAPPALETPPTRSGDRLNLDQQVVPVALVVHVELEFALVRDAEALDRRGLTCGHEHERLVQADGQAEARIPQILTTYRTHGPD